MTDKSKMILWYVGIAALAISFSYVAYHFVHPTIAILIIIVPVALIANGFLAEAEDNAPGGYNNPDEKPHHQGKNEKNDEKKKTDWGFLSLGVLMVVVGIIMIIQGITAYKTGALIPATNKSGPMTGIQSVITGVVAAVAGFVFVGNIGFKILKSKNRESNKAARPDR